MNKQQEQEEYSEQYQESESENNYAKWGTNCRKYSRITPEVKDKLIFLIVRNNMSIKQAAQYLKINYSSAKFIFSQYRDRNQRCDQPAQGNTHKFIIRKLSQNQTDDIDLKYTVGGKYEGQSNQIFTAFEINQKSIKLGDPSGN